MADHIKSLISTFLDKEQNWQIELISNWNSIVGQLKAHVSLEVINNNGTLVLGVDNSSWMHELNMLSNILIKKINDSLKREFVKKIRFTIVYNHKKIVRKKEWREDLKIKEVRLNFRQELALQKIKDPELNKELIKFLQKCQSYDK